MAVKIMAGTSLEKLLQELIPFKFLTSSAGVFSDRARRRYDKTAKEIGDQMKLGKELPKSSPFELHLRWDDEMGRAYARQLSLALKEFKQVNPEAYEQFEEIRSKHKKSRRASLEFRGTVEDEKYIDAIIDLIGSGMIEELEAGKIYEALLAMSGGAKSASEEMYRYLLPE